MPNATAQATPEAISLPPKKQRADRFEATHRALENDVYDLMRMLRAADHIQAYAAMGDEDLASSGRLLVEQAAKMAEDLNEKYQQGFVKMREGIDSRIDEDDPTAKALILRELDACERLAAGDPNSG